MKKNMKQKLTVWLLLFCMVISLLPVAASPPSEAEAVEARAADLNSLKFKASMGDHTVAMDANGDLIVTGNYLSNSQALLSYHTYYLYFHREFSGGNPGAVKYFPINVFFHESEPSSNSGYVTDTFIISQAKLAEAALFLYSEEELKGQTEITVYISEGFCLKSRKTASDRWTYLRGKIYSSLSDIQNAAKWSQGTQNGFKDYYDTMITFSLSELGINIDPKYDLYVDVDDDATGVAYGSGSYSAGDKVPVRAVPNDGYIFKEWTVQGGSSAGFDKTKADTVFTMPSSDVTLIANFEKERIPEPTKKPVVTPKPGDPTPTPMPTPTLAPTPTPVLPDPSETYGQNIWYYGTEQGYTIKGIYEQDGPLAGISSAENSHIRSDEYTALDAYYSVGRDSSGNTWYFIPDGTNATFVHPDIYQGKDANSPQVKDIRELVFPETITYSGKTYTVTSIGGGTDRYHSYAQDASQYSPYTGYVLDKISGSYYYTNSVKSTSGTRETYQNINGYTGYHYGVVGNGEITSSWSIHFDFFQDGNYSYSYRDYESSYYVYNTTLEFVTIPDTVTEICDYAFYQCQGLRKITGAGGVTNIGESAFAGARVLTTTPSVEVSGNYKRYHYNESYSTGIPTDTMRSWQSAVALREYMELAGFPVLDTIGTYAFAYRKNLFDVKLPACVSVIKDDAFKACDLNSITIPGKNTTMEESNGKMAGRDTLGTKGNPDTVIITVPESKAMYYGLTYEDYYTLRCGYPVTYDKNALPAEEYTTASMLAVLKKERKKSFSGAIESYGNNGSVSISVAYEVVLDTEGRLWLKNGGALFPEEVLPGVKFKDICGVTLSEKSSWSGSKSYSYCFAFAENGNVWVYDPGKYGAASWKDTGIPEGSTGHQWCCYPFSDLHYESGSSGYSSESSSSVKKYYLYYADKNGRLFRKEMYETTSGSYYSSNSGSASTTSHIIRTGSAAEALSGPGGIVFGTFHVMDSVTGRFFCSDSWGDGYSGTTTEYSLYQPTVFAKDTEGNYWKGTGQKTDQRQYSVTDTGGTRTEKTDGFSQSEADAKILDASGYTWEHLGAVRQIWDGGEKGKGASLNVLDADGNLLFFYNTEKKPASGSNLLNCGEVRAVLSGKNFVAADVITAEYALLTDADGSTWVYPYRNRAEGSSLIHKPRQLPGEVQVTAQWETKRSYSGEEYGKNVSYEEYTLFLLDSSNRLWVTTDTCKIQYNSYDGSLYTSWTASGPECLLSGIEKVYIHREGTANQEIFVLDGDGSIWTYADNTISEILEPEALEDALLKMRKSAYSVGYEFVETLYANMFLRQGYRFLTWNTKMDGSGTSYRPGERILLTAPVTLYAQWERAKNIIRYAPNGGSGIMEDDVYEPEVAEAVLKRNTYTKSGYEFTGWNTKADGSGSPYADRASITIPPGTTVLYAQWKPFSYVVKVAEDEVRVTPVTVTDTIELDYDEEMTIPAARPDRFYTLAYRLNRKSTMSTVPYWKTADPDADRYTKASLTFLGWQLYEETEDGYDYLGFYKPGETVKNLARQKGCTLYLFPYWGGEASYVDLPVAGCDGYDFIGWSTDKDESDVTKVIRAAEGSVMRYKPKGNETMYAYYEPKKYDIALVAKAPDAESGEITKEQDSVTVTFDQIVPDAGIPVSARHVFLGYYDRLDRDGKPAEGAVRYYDENGNGLQVWRIHDGSVTALYAYLISEKEVTLDGRGATKQEQTSVIMTYDKTGPDVIPPEKTGYTFEGYFTEIRGGGKKYFDENGRGIKVWLEKDVDVLYACWKQNPVELPEKEETKLPAVLPETELVIEAVQENMCVQIYADDNNPATGAEDDLPPYQVSDIYSGTKLLTEGAIPSTECVAMRAQMGSYLFSGILSRKSGITQVRTYAVIQYRTVYEDAETEDLIISEPRTTTVEVMVPKAWSYWELKEGGLYYPSYTEVKNAALKEKSVQVSVEWDGYENKKPSYTYTSYEEHVVWSGYDTDGLPMCTLTAPQEYRIISDIPGEEPDITEYVTAVAENLARADGSEFKVRNDFLQIGDVTVLSDREQERDSVAPADNIAELLCEKIPLTAYEQTYVSGVPLFKESKNQTYESSAVCVYEADSCVSGEIKTMRKNAEVNDISVHTPVLCNAVLLAAHEDKYQCEEIPEESTVLVLSEMGVHSDFTVQILNTGYHSSRKGYGENSYEQYLAEKEGKAQNEIRFPFDVWIDIGNDRDSENDFLLEKGVWYTIGTEKQRFYVPLWIKEGEYSIEMRSVAVNGKDSEEKTENGRNIQKENYVAVAEKRVYITGRLCDFTVYDICGTAAWEEVRGEELSYPVDNLPLRAGVHPYYKNVGGLPAGGSFSFRIKSIGSFYGKDALLTLVPEFVLVTGKGREAVDVYYEKETAQGVFLKKWGEEETIAERYGEKEETPIQYWYGRFTLPDTLYAAESGTDVSGYQKRYGLNFSENFWIKKGKLLLQFAIRVENGNGEVLYYGKLPVNIKNDIWCQESGKEICTDTYGSKYRLEGGDAAIIYLGESAAGDYTIHGIH